MKIAFTSCMSAQIFPDQPVWDEIAAAAPDVLVLLGDSIYLDVGSPYDTAGIKALGMTPDAFAQHAHARYREQLAQPRFKALVQRPSLTTYAIWDDHDFLWNNSCGADVAATPAWRDLAYPTRALFAAYRNTLAQRLAAGSFPAVPPPWNAATPEPGYSMVALGQGIYLHLTDGRSYKKRNGKAALLGAAQLDALELQLKNAPAGSTHLLASGVVFEARSGECWLQCNAEHQRLLQLAQSYNILMLSGDIHDNNLASYQLAPGSNRYLYEATSSGAAVKTAVVFGSLQRNWGLLRIDATQVNIEIFKSGASNYKGTVNRNTWL